MTGKMADRRHWTALAASLYVPKDSKGNAFKTSTLFSLRSFAFVWTSGHMCVICVWYWGPGTLGRVNAGQGSYH